MYRNQGTGELFGGHTGVLGNAERIFYNLLIKNNRVTLEEVRDELYPNEAGQKISSNRCYKKIITAGSNVITAIREKGGLVEEQRNGRNKIWIYDGIDILKEERTVSDVKTIKKLVELFEASSGMIPFSVSSHFLEDSTLFGCLKRNITRDRIVYAEGNPRLKGLELIPELYEHIVRQHVLQFKYHPFGKKPYSPIIHPHAIKLYNNRWFLLGYTKRKDVEEYDISCIALDRIESALYVKAVEYKACEEGLYSRFFDKRVGVSGKQTDVPVEIIIHAHSAYAMGLITTKPFPHQRVIHEYDDRIGYGEVAIQAVWNDELCGDIMRYGSLFEVVGPPEIRENIKCKLLKTLNNYK